MDWDKELGYYDSSVEACNGFERKGKIYGTKFCFR